MSGADRNKWLSQALKKYVSKEPRPEWPIYFGEHEIGHRVMPGLIVSVTVARYAGYAIYDVLVRDYFYYIYYA